MPWESWVAPFNAFLHRFLDSIVVSISACHVEGPGSIPGRGVLFGNRLSTSFVAKIWLLGGSNP